MEVVCNKCGYRRNVGGILRANDVSSVHQFFSDVLKCTECESVDVRLVDSGGLNIKIDGVNEDTVRVVISELMKSVSLKDIWNFFTKKKEE